MAEHLAMSDEDRSGIAFPVAHIGGPINLVAALVSGATLLLVEHFDPVPTCAVLAREGVTMAGSGTAFHLAYLEVQARRPQEPLFPFLRCCPGGGAPKPPGLHERVKRELGGAGICAGWGLTEAPVLTMAKPGDPDVALDESEGSALPGVELRTVTPDGRVGAPGEAGELRVRAPQVMLGYVDAALDADAFDEEGWLRTGDLGTIDAGGYVRITGRLKDVVIRNGENVGTAEVEDLLRGHPHVADAAVIGLPDPRTGERLCAVVELVPGAPTLDVAASGRSWATTASAGRPGPSRSRRSTHSRGPWRARSTSPVSSSAIGTDEDRLPIRRRDSPAETLDLGCAYRSGPCRPNDRVDRCRWPSNGAYDAQSEGSCRVRRGSCRPRSVLG